MKVAAALAALLLTGCVAAPQSGFWDNQTHDGSNFERDKAQCLYEAAAATASAPATFSLSQNMAQDVATGVRREELARMCLQARGYFWNTGTTTPVVWGSPAGDPTLPAINRGLNETSDQPTDFMNVPKILR